MVQTQQNNGMFTTYQLVQDFAGPSIVVLTVVLNRTKVADPPGGHFGLSTQLPLRVSPDPKSASIISAILPQYVGMHRFSTYIYIYIYKCIIYIYI